MIRAAVSRGFSRKGMFPIINPQGDSDVLNRTTLTKIVQWNALATISTPLRAFMSTTTTTMESAPAGKMDSTMMNSKPLSEDFAKINAFAARTGLVLSDSTLLSEALTHKSYQHRNDEEHGRLQLMGIQKKFFLFRI